MTPEQIVSQIEFASPAWVFAVPCILMVLDFATGILNAWIKHEIDSSVMRKGLVKKCGEVVILCIGELIVFSTIIPIRNQIMAFLSLYISVMELVSIAENLDLLGVPLPGFVVRALRSAAKDMDDGKEEK